MDNSRNVLLLRNCFRVFLLVLMLSISSAKAGIANGGFEHLRDGLAVGWGGLWTRQQGAGSLVFDKEVRHGGSLAARIEHTGREDWSLNSDKRLDVEAADIFELSCWVRVRGDGNVIPCVVAYDGAGKVRDWMLGQRTVGATQDWVQVRSKFVIPKNVSSIIPRVIGTGPATVWVDDYALVRIGNIAQLRGKGGRKKLSLSNKILTLTVDPSDGNFSVTDKRTGRVWRQKPFRDDKVVLEAAVGNGIEMTVLDATSGIELSVNLRLEADRPEVVATLSGKGRLERTIQYPHPFASAQGDRLIVPMNEGIGYPADDKTIAPMRLIAYGGHGICMSFWGVSRDAGAYMAIIETPDDMRINMNRIDGRLCIGGEWEAQKGKFSYARRLRYVFFDKGDHVEMCKRYRRYVQEKGTFKTLKEKRLKNPNVDLLVGAVNVWCWEKDALAIARELKAAGIDRILWSNRKSPEIIEAMNRMPGVLTSRYDIYQDLMDPEVVRKHLRRQHPDWTQDGWPEDLMLDARGNWRKGWRVKGTDGNMYPCGVLCDRQAVKYARQRVPQELKTHPYRCRFIDTTTASPWRECYDTDHPMTRTESKFWKMQLLKYMSQEAGLVTGSETGHDAAVPYVHYFEGMMSLGHYRIPDAGRNMSRIVQDVPERVAKFQVGQKYRLPLWELVYHDCVVAQWYWGDYNNKLPAIWDKRDLFNILYATPPMFMFNRQTWSENKDRFAQSYRNICPLVRSVGYEEMVDHRTLTADRNVQQTEFANGIEVTVNFGSKMYRLKDGREVAPTNFIVKR